MNGAVRGSDAQAALLQASFLQSTSDDIEEIKRMLKEMQSKLQEMDVPAHGTSPPTHDLCCASERKSLRTRQLNLSAFAVSSIVCLQGIVAACLTAVLWKRGAMDHPSLPHKPYELAVTFLIIETLLAILAFCGCWSVRKKSPIMMTLTAAANSILILIQFGTLGWTFSRTPKASHSSLYVYVCNRSNGRKI
ncbi:unnamed protein product [Dibothriocephalus latus]|uniref:Uncharacterized protein n=1 Tax=Dibothriocephalus latus TaxID=60516 RepID=A0A3P7LCM5_DIBLA|nr:unnamed protein product [Dibothriocephalus latus]